jgi:hypothetical protein
MADVQGPEDPETHEEPAAPDETDPRADERDKSIDEDTAAEVIDDDRFQATDN